MLWLSAFYGGRKRIRICQPRFRFNDNTQVEMVRLLKRMLLRINGEPREIARGVAIGVFVGMTPFFGIHIPISLGLASLLRGNYVAALIGIQITNVFTAPFIYALSFKIGSWFHKADIVFNFSDFLSMDAILHLFGTFRDVIIILCIGGVLIGLPLSLISHLCVYYLFKTMLHPEGEK